MTFTRRGDNIEGQCGQGGSIYNAPCTPGKWCQTKRVPRPSYVDMSGVEGKAVELATGHSHACIRTARDEFYCWVSTELYVTKQP